MNKELSIEEKAKAYDKAIERAKQHCADYVVETIFPELKESEGEKMRKVAIEFVKQNNSFNWLLGVSKEQVLDWLEKQGEHANFLNKIQIGDKVTRNEDGVLVNLSQLKRVAKPAEEYNITGIGSKNAKGKLGEMIKKKLEMEKQGEQKPVFEMKTPEESLGIDSDTYNKIVDECVYGEQKTTDKVNSNLLTVKRAKEISPFMRSGFENESNDKVEPKFHEGDWVVYCNEDVDLITGIEENGYCINNGGYIPFICASDIRLWTIQDAKDGDVLATKDNCICIFDNTLEEGKYPFAYCGLSMYGFKVYDRTLPFTHDNVYPATKEQRDTLEKAMTDAGYTFDFEKKELKKVINKEQIKKNLQDNSFCRMFENKPTEWNEEDGEIVETLNEYVKNLDILFSEIKIGNKDILSKEFRKKVQSWLKSIKDRVQPQPKQEWSKLDNRIEDCIGMCLTDISEKRFDDFKTSLKECLDWLHSLKDRMWYQPSQEWSEEDKRLLGNILFDLETLRKSAGIEKDASLYQDEINWLKSLRPQNTWKPCDEQMDALRYVTNFDYGGYKATLVSLYEQLKKLRG